MADKDLLGIIADMLRKLDQHSEILNKHSEILEIQSESLKKQNDALTSYMDGSLKRFDQQQLFNEQLLKMNDKIVDRLENLEARSNRN